MCWKDQGRCDYSARKEAVKGKVVAVEFLVVPSGSSNRSTLERSSTMYPLSAKRSAARLGMAAERVHAT